MSGKVHLTTKPDASRTYPASGVLQRKCACGSHTVAGGDCESCQKERTSAQMQRAAIGGESVNEVPPIVHEVLRSSGQPLDANTRSFFESRFDHDFSQVRLHTDSKAAQSAQSVNALAYTVGRDVVFGAGQFAPQSSPGRMLIAHELTHVLQQNGENGSPSRISGQFDDAEKEATSLSAGLIQTDSIPDIHVQSGSSILRRQGLSKEEILKRIAENEEKTQSPVSRTSTELLALQTERNHLLSELTKLKYPASTTTTTPKTAEKKTPEPISVPVSVDYTLVGTIEMPTATGSSTAAPPLQNATGTSKPTGPEHLAPAGLGAGGQSIVRFIDPLPGTQALGKPDVYTRYFGPSLEEGAAGFFDPNKLTMTKELGPRLYQGQMPETVIQAEQAWKAAGVSPTELYNASDLLKKKGFQNLTAEEAALVRRVTYGHTQIAPAYKSSPLISMTELLPEQALQKLPPTATNRAYVIRVQIKEEDVGRVNEILKESKEAARLSGEVEVVVAKNIAKESGNTNSGLKILSIKANPKGTLGGIAGTALKWTGRAAVVIGLGLAIKDVVTAAGPHKREIQGQAAGSFAGATVLGAFAVGLCIGLGVATGGLAILGCGLLGGILGGAGGDFLGGKIGSLFD
jgi:Domain of unknown function (DUF4157)